MIDQLYIWSDIGRPDKCDVHLPFEFANTKVVVVEHILDMEYLDVLKMMHGKDVKVQYLWDWHDELYDLAFTRKGRPDQPDLSLFFRGVFSTRYDLHDLLGRANEVKSRKRKNDTFIRHRNDPPITFHGPKEFYL